MMETKFERIVGATISVRVDYQTLDDIVVTALEGGIGVAERAVAREVDHVADHLRPHIIADRRRGLRQGDAELFNACFDFGHDNSSFLSSASCRPGRAAAGAIGFSLFQAREGRPSLFRRREVSP